MALQPHRGGWRPKFFFANPRARPKPEQIASDWIRLANSAIWNHRAKARHMQALRRRCPGRLRHRGGGCDARQWDVFFVSLNIRGGLPYIVRSCSSRMRFGWILLGAE